MKGLTASPVAPFPHGLHFSHQSWQTQQYGLGYTPLGEVPLVRGACAQTSLSGLYKKTLRRAASHCHDNYQDFLWLRCLRERRESVCKKHLLEIEENCQGNQQGCYRQSVTNDRHIVKYERHLQFNKKKRQAWTICRHFICFLIKEESTESTSHFVFFFLSNILFLYIFNVSNLLNSITHDLKINFSYICRSIPDILKWLVRFLLTLCN